MNCAQSATDHPAGHIVCESDQRNMTDHLQPGAVLPPLDKPRLMSTHIVRWMAAQQNWDRIHFDQVFCREIAQLPAPVINGALKQQLIMQFLQQALAGAWPWRVDYQFIRPDFVGEKLQVRGYCGHRQERWLEVDIQIVNLDQAQVTTRGHATVLLPRLGPVLDAMDPQAPDDLILPLEPTPPERDLPFDIRVLLGTELEQRESRYPLDLSRLRLFADAVMDLNPVHYDLQADSPWGSVVAPPLFPPHGLEARPGDYPLSEAPDAQGREGVNEVGRDLAARFGWRAAGGMNAGNRVQVHSLARVGERLQVRSVLVAAKLRRGARGEMLFLETLNRYSEAGGRPLLDERQTVVYRLLPS